jgi:hypothetical protein
MNSVDFTSHVTKRAARFLQCHLLLQMCIAPQVSIIDDTLMPAHDTLWCAGIGGLSPGCSKAGFSWLVGIRSKSKSCPPFINWHVRNVALPCIDECRSHCPFPDSPAFYSVDGEAKVMNPMPALTSYLCGASASC